MRCNICSSDMLFFAQELLLAKYSVNYYRCSFCGYIHTEEPYWLEESYSSAISCSDIGLIHRNLIMSVKTQAIISTWFDSSKCFLDFAGGYGMLVRLMRDAGYNFHWKDKYCLNLFAAGFTSEDYNNVCYELVTAFELFEHMQNPLSEIEHISFFSRNILFSTEIIPKEVPRPDSWWYYGLNHGQHISFYTLKSLQVIADKLSLNFYTDGTSLHMFTDKHFSPTMFRIAVSSVVSNILSLISKRKTLLFEDAKSKGCNI